MVRGHSFYTVANNIRRNDRLPATARGLRPQDSRFFRDSIPDCAGCDKRLTEPGPPKRGSRMPTLDGLTTEGVNPDSAGIDALETEEALRVMNDADAGVPAAVRAEIPRIARVVEWAVASLRAGGRLIW